MLSDDHLKAVYAAAGKDYAAEWKLLDDVLYDVCAKHPGHGDRTAVNAKLYLVGRSFASGIERLIVSDGLPGGALKKLCDHLVSKAASIDREILRLPRTETPSDEEFRTVVEVHGAVVKLIQPMLRRGTPRSFVSKYLCGV